MCAKASLQNKVKRSWPGTRPVVALFVCVYFGLSAATRPRVTPRRVANPVPQGLRALPVTMPPKNAGGGAGKGSADGMAIVMAAVKFVLVNFVLSVCALRAIFMSSPKRGFLNVRHFDIYLGVSLIRSTQMCIGSMRG